MRIAFLSREYPPDTAWGGIATFYHQLAHSLAERGHEIHVICQAVAGPRDYAEDGVFVHRVGTNPKRYSAMARVNYTFCAWLKLREIIKKHGIEIVEATYWGAEGLVYSPRKRAPLVVRADVSASDIIRTETYSGKKELLGLRILSYLEDFTAKRADRVIAISQEMYTRATGKLRIDPERVDLVHHGIDTSKYRLIESDVRERLEVPRDDPLVLFVGRLEARKGVHVLCEAIPQIVRSMPLAKFVLVGRDTNTAPDGGSFASYVTRKAKDHGFTDSLRVIGFLSPDELVQVYSTCHVVVLPSLQEGFSMVILEALACGKPVVTTFAGGATDIGLTPPSGIIVSPNDATELAQAIVSILSLKDEDKLLVARRNRELAESRFSVAAWADRVAEVYNQALAVGTPSQVP